jgi:hypothetical protein
LIELAPKASNRSARKAVRLKNQAVTVRVANLPTMSHDHVNQDRIEHFLEYYWAVDGCNRRPVPKAKKNALYPTLVDPIFCPPAVWET